MIGFLSQSSRALKFAALAFLLTAPSASAQGFVAPFVGGTLGGATESRSYVYGVTAGLGGPIGLDVDFARAPRLFDRGELSDRDTRLGVSTLMLNVRFGAPVGSGIQPYISGGAGLIRSRLSSRDDRLDGESRNDFGVNVGAGLDLRMGSAVALRGDLRYFRSRAGDRGVTFDRYDAGLERITFWRATAGVAIRF